MKLRNKKTGEIVDTIGDCTNGFTLRFKEGDTIFIKSLSELDKEWEDYKQRPWWYIDIHLVVKQGELFLLRYAEELKEVGNYFETREEAELAVRKLKAITRLNKCDFKFEGYNNRDRVNGGDIVIYAHVDIPNNNLLEEAQPAMLEDLDILFGGEK